MPGVAIHASGPDTRGVDPLPHLTCATAQPAKSGTIGWLKGHCQGFT